MSRVMDYSYGDPMLCVHGVKVGGCGPDYMCGRCEAGPPWSLPDVLPDLYPGEKYAEHDRYSPPQAAHVATTFEHVMDAGTAERFVAMRRAIYPRKPGLGDYLEALARA